MRKRKRNKKANELTVDSPKVIRFSFFVIWVLENYLLFFTIPMAPKTMPAAPVTAPMIPKIKPNCAIFFIKVTSLFPADMHFLMSS